MEESNIIIAFTGYARSGKDFASNIMKREYNYATIKFAQKLYEMLAVMLECGISDIERMKVDGECIPGTNCTIRQALQTLGTEWGRDKVHERIWALTLCNKIKTLNLKKVVISDLRFINEAITLKEFAEENNYDLYIIGLERPESEPQTHHRSEIDIDKIILEYSDAVIYNNVSCHELERRILNVVNN